jgi:hypothetical protein
MLPNAQPRPRPRVLDKRDEQRELSALEARVRHAVQERDQYQCRCCGRKEALHLHHLTYRSRGGKWETSNIVTLDAICHALLHARQLWILGKNADRRLTFEIDERVVIHVFGRKELPRDVRIIKATKGSV